MKKFVKFSMCLILSLMLITCCYPVATATEYNQASTGTNNYIYFDTSGWKNFNTIFCHIWERGGNSFFDLQDKKEKCEPVDGSDTLYAYDLSKLNDSNNINGGIKKNTDYFVIFSTNNLQYTYEITFGSECIGDTVKLTNKYIDIGSVYIRREAIWKNNNSKYGPHLVILPNDNVIGSTLCPNESATQVIGDWLITNYSKSNVMAEAVLVNAFPKFKVYDVEKVYKYICSKNTGKDEATMYEILKKAEKKAYGEFTLSKKSTKLYIKDTYKIKVNTGNRKGEISYKSNNKKIATVSKTGKITAKKAGKTTIEVKFYNTIKKLLFP